MRNLLPVIGLVSILLLAGCMGVGLDKTEYSAPPAVVTDDVAAENGFELQSAEQFEFNKTIEVNDNEYRVTATNWMTMYEKSNEIELGATNQTVNVMSIFGIVSTPSIKFAGQELNPLVRTPTDEVVTRVTQENEQISVKKKVSETTVTHNTTGQEITVEKYDAQFTMQNGQTVDGYVLISVFAHNDAVLVTVGIYPDQYDQEDAIQKLVQNVVTVENAPTTNGTDSS